MLPRTDASAITPYSRLFLNLSLSKECAEDYAYEVIQLGVAVEAGAGRDEANPAGTRVHKEEKISSC